MNLFKNKSLSATLGISIFIALFVSLVFNFGGLAVSALMSLVLPQGAAFTWWKAAIVVAVGAATGVLTQKFSLKRIARYIAYFIIIWFCASVAANQVFGISLTFIPITFTILLVTLFTHIRNCLLYTSPSPRD